MTQNTSLCTSEREIKRTCVLYAYDWIKLRVSEEWEVDRSTINRHAQTHLSALRDAHAALTWSHISHEGAGGGAAGKKNPNDTNAPNFSKNTMSQCEAIDGLSRIIRGCRFAATSGTQNESYSLDIV